MVDQLIIVEIALRGAAAGLNILLAGLLLFSRKPGLVRALGALFAIGTAAYVLVSADHFEILGPLEPAGEFLAVYNTIFFWWFALSLFEDRFTWDWVKLAPPVYVTFLHAPLEMWQTPAGLKAEPALHVTMSLLLLLHAIWIALRDRNTDLVGPRRRFRLVFALMVGVAGILLTLGESLYKLVGLPDAATLLHAFALFALTFYFVFWLLSVSRAFFAVDPPLAGPVAALPPPPNGALERASTLTPADRPAFDALNALMEAGVYREEGLTVARLADKVGVPEHQLRRLINRELGFRNFTAFLNARRIEDAKAALANPANGKKQVLQIALDLGYGSVAPFNRAFKEATGRTPTEFRKGFQQNGRPEG